MGECNVLNVKRNELGKLKILLLIFFCSYAGHKMDLGKAVAGCDSKFPIILLAHQPKAAKMAVQSPFNIQLVLTGLCSLSYSIVFIDFIQHNLPVLASEICHMSFHVHDCFSGHTHGGQIFPYSLIIYMLNPYYHGLYRDGASQVFVGQGTQYWGIPMRIASQNEVSVLILKSVV